MADRHVAKPSRKLWGAVRVWAWLYMAASVCLAGSLAYRLHLFSQLAPEGPFSEMDDLSLIVPGAEMEFWTTSGAFLLYVAAYVVCIVLVLMWYLRSVRNAKALIAGVRTSPAWAVWYFFIPLISYWKPYGMTSELWRSAHAPDDWKRLPDVPLIRWWWALVLFGSFAGTYANLGSRMAGTVMEMQVSEGALVASLVLNILAGLMFLRIGGRITDLQNRLIETGRERPTPPPGRFAD